MLYLGVGMEGWSVYRRSEKGCTPIESPYAHRHFYSAQCNIKMILRMAALKDITEMPGEDDKSYPSACSTPRRTRY